MTDRKETEGAAVEIEAIDMEEWEAGQRTPEANDAKLEALVRQTAAIPVVTEPLQRPSTIARTPTKQSIKPPAPQLVKRAVTPPAGVPQRKTPVPLKDAVDDEWGDVFDSPTVIPTKAAVDDMFEQPTAVKPAPAELRQKHATPASGMPAILQRASAEHAKATEQARPEAKVRKPTSGVPGIWKKTQTLAPPASEKPAEPPARPIAPKTPPGGVAKTQNLPSLDPKPKTPPSGVPKAPLVVSTETKPKTPASGVRAPTMQLPTITAKPQGKTPQAGVRVVSTETKPKSKTPPSGAGIIKLPDLPDGPVEEFAWPGESGPMFDVFEDDLAIPIEGAVAPPVLPVAAPASPKVVIGDEDSTTEPVVIPVMRTGPVRVAVEAEVLDDARTNVAKGPDDLPTSPPIARRDEAPAAAAMARPPVAETPPAGSALPLPPPPVVEAEPLLPMPPIVPTPPEVAAESKPRKEWIDPRSPSFGLPLVEAAQPMAPARPPVIKSAHDPRSPSFGLPLVEAQPMEPARPAAVANPSPQPYPVVRRPVVEEAPSEPPRTPGDERFTTTDSHRALVPRRVAWIGGAAAGVIALVIILVAVTRGGGSDEPEQVASQPAVKPPEPPPEPKRVVVPDKPVEPDPPPVDPVVAEPPVVAKPPVVRQPPRVPKKPAIAKVKADPELKAAAKPGVDLNTLRTAYNSGNQRLFAGDAAAAIKAYQQTLSLAPTYAPGYRGLGLAYAQQGNKVLAVNALKKYVALAPNAKDVKLIQNRIAALQGR
jgi:hypothetical protein